MIRFLPRRLGTLDLRGLLRLKEAAGWNQTEADWRRLLELEPEGCFGLDCEGVLAASATVVCYGTDLAWIGMVLTLPEFRGRGLARQLLEHALEWCRERRVRTVKLDATDMGVPLYRSLGFEDECAVERWLRPACPDAAAAELPPDGAPDFKLDREAFGADRSRLLRKLQAEGYGAGRPGSKAAYFGPCVSRTAEKAGRNLRAFLAAHPGEDVFWDLLPENSDAVRLAGEHGFTRVRQLVRMAKTDSGDRPVERGNPALVFGTAGFEYG